MIEGLYKAEFETPFGKGSGVLLLKDGLIHGGNTALYYIGRYDVTGNSLHAHIKTRRHTQDLQTASVFGMDDINVIIEGVIDGEIIMLDGVAEEVPDMQMRGRFSLLPHQD